jgi:hypothetical protein
MAVKPGVISVLIPTWGRPERLREAVQSAKATATDPAAVEVLVRVCHNDPRITGYVDAPHELAQVFHVGGHETYGKGIEFLQARAQGEILLAASDDVIFRTPGWDVIVRDAFEAYPDGLAVMYANNGLDREKCEHFFTTRRWVDAVGYMVWPEFRHFCVDQWVEELAVNVGRLRFLRQVVIEHMHRKYRKAPNDATYEAVRGATGTSDKDNQLYRERAGERERATARLRAIIERATP